MSVSPRLRLLRIVGRLEVAELALRSCYPTVNQVEDVHAAGLAILDDLNSLMGELE